MKAKQVKKLLSSEIRKIASAPEHYCVNPGTDFTRHRKLPMDRLLAGIIGLGGGSLACEIMEMFTCTPETPSASAFIQQRNKLKPNALEDLFHGFSERLSSQWHRYAT